MPLKSEKNYNCVKSRDDDQLAFSGIYSIKDKDNNDCMERKKEALQAALCNLWSSLKQERGKRNPSIVNRSFILTA